MTRVRLDYRGYTEAEAAAAVALFDRAFRRGGGWVIDSIRGVARGDVRSRVHTGQP